MARRLTKKVEIQAYADKVRQQACDRAEASIDAIAQGLARIAFGLRKSLYDDRGRLKLPKDWSEEDDALIESVESEELFETVTDVEEVEGRSRKKKRKELVGYVRKIKTARRVEALKILAQWRRMISADEKLIEMGREIAELKRRQDESNGRNASAKPSGTGD